jgi:hypothetical protein
LTGNSQIWRSAASAEPRLFLFSLYVFTFSCVVGSELGCSWARVSTRLKLKHGVIRTGYGVMHWILCRHASLWPHSYFPCIVLDIKLSTSDFAASPHEESGVAYAGKNEPTFKWKWKWNEIENPIYAYGDRSAWGLSSISLYSVLLPWEISADSHGSASRFVQHQLRPKWGRSAWEKGVRCADWLNWNNSLDPGVLIEQELQAQWYF